jgi:hypothetical protein
MKTTFLPHNKGVFSDLYSSDKEYYRRLKVETMTLDITEFLDGNKYQIYGDTGLLLAGTGVKYIKIVTGEIDIVITAAKVSVEGGDTELIGYENASNTGGTPVPVRRFNLAIPNMHTTEVFADPTINVVGDEIDRVKTFGVAINQGNRPATIANIQSGQAFYLPKNSEFLWEIKNTDQTDGSKAFFNLVWFEKNYLK